MTSTTACTQSTLAELAGVSQKTVNLALRGVPGVNKVTRQRIMDLAKQHGYRPNAAARAMVSRETRQIGVLEPNVPGRLFHNPLVHEVLIGINRGLEKAGYVVCLARLDEVEDNLLRSNRILGENLVDGVLVLGLVPESFEQTLQNAVEHCIWVDCNVDRPTGCIRRDEVHVGKEAAAGLAKAGYRHIIWLTYPQQDCIHYSHVERYAGLSQAARAHNIKITSATKSDFDQGTLHLSDLSPDTAILTDGIFFAEWVLYAAHMNGCIVGRDFGLASCDESQRTAAFCNGLSRVTFDRYAMGLQAAQMMLALLNEPSLPTKSVKVGGQWIPGTTAPGPVN